MIRIAKWMNEKHVAAFVFTAALLFFSLLSLFRHPSFGADSRAQCECETYHLNDSALNDTGFFDSVSVDACTFSFFTLCLLSSNRFRGRMSDFLGV